MRVGILERIKISLLTYLAPINYIIESAFGKNLISRYHTTIKRRSGRKFVIYDHSTNGTFVNYVRVNFKATLNNGDIGCF